MHIGHGSAGGHHGEILQGVFATPRGWTPAILTLPCPEYGSTATFRPRPGLLTVLPDGKSKALAAARAMLKTIDAESHGGTLEIHTSAPIGFGSAIPPASWYRDFPA